MKSRISALMDNELDAAAAAEPLAALGSEGEARKAWRTYHIISDALRETNVLSEGFSRRLTERLAQEPTVVAPRALERAYSRLQRPALTAAASLAAVAMVGWLAYDLPEQQATQPGQVVAVQQPQVAPQASRTPAAAKPQAVQVPLPSQAHDYLLAHQGYSPRNSLQGMAPYVRMVSAESGTGKR